MDAKERLIALFVSWNEKPVATIQEKVEIIASEGLLAPEWVSVKERLPELGPRQITGVTYGDDVLFMENDGDIHLGYLCENDDGRLAWFSKSNREIKRWDAITHWQPLPQPPKTATTPEIPDAQQSGGTE